ncbi:MAG TPA: AzlD domain-containing protein [Anaerolineales bacterium]|jgi:branched-subunit amino acid transport protein|nr:AzlD domain-containing protein [Anaerolineales bacterium]
MSIWLVMIAIGVMTYATRLSFILLFGKMEIPRNLRRALRFVPAAVLPAIIFPELLVRDGVLNLSLGNERMLAGILAFLVAWRTKSAVLTIFIGMAALLLLQTLLN